MPVDIAAYLPADADDAQRRLVTPHMMGMSGSMILGIAAAVRQRMAAGQTVCNLTVGDFAPAHFPIPEGLRTRIQAALQAGETNYPPPDGLPALKAAICAWYARTQGLLWTPDCVVVASGARPPIYATWRLLVEPGDRTTSFTPGWNVGYYAHLTQADHRFVPTRAEDNFFPTVEMARAAIRESRLVILNSPQNPTGTVIDPAVLAGIANALVEENAGRERPCVLLFDQVYWPLTGHGATHHNPVALVPACAPYVVHVDALSKGFAGTGLRVGWAVMPPYLASRMAALIGHVGAWAPRAEQVAAAAFLQDVPAVEAYLTDFRAAVNARLDRFHDGIQALVAEGLPVNSIAPQGAIYLSFRVDLIGQPFATNEEIRRWLLDEAGIAVVPFQAFDLMEESGWFRLSVGAVGLAEIDAALLRLQALLRRHLAARLPAATRGLPPSSPPQEP